MAIKLKKPKSAVATVAKAAKDVGCVIDFPVDKPEEKPIELTEDDVAEDFAVKYQGRLRFDHEKSKWYLWTGVRWEQDKTHAAFHYVRMHCREVRKGETKLASRKAAEGVESLARRDQRLAMKSDDWDKDSMLLGTPGGTVDLTTGAIRAADPDDFITRLTAVTPAEPGTAHPVFSKFLHEATGGDEELQRFLQRWAGYALTGLTWEHSLLFMYGPGGNGKSVFQNVLHEIMNEYVKTAPMELFAASKHQTHSTEIAMLHGARLVIASETEKGQTWAEAKIYRLTGDDPISARFLYQDNFTFRPIFKLMIAGNHKPQLKVVNEAARRRFMMVPFLNKPVNPDHALKEKLRAEYAQILRWMIDGCIEWQKIGLARPPVVTTATEEYFEEQDLFGRWITERCLVGPDYIGKATDLYQSWREFAISNGEEPGTMKMFASMLAGCGYKKKKSGSTLYLRIQAKSL